MAIVRKGIGWFIAAVVIVYFLFGGPTATIFAQVGMNVGGGSLAAMFYGLDDLVEGWAGVREQAKLDPDPNLNGGTPRDTMPRREPDPSEKTIAPAPPEGPA